MKVINIPLEKIEQNENSRVVYKQVDTNELMVSMKKEGLLQPIGVRTLPNGKYEAVFGNRRYLAAKRLGWKEIEAHVVDIDNAVDSDFVGLIENMKRVNTSVQEDGRIFQTFRDRGLSISEIAARLDVTEDRIKLALEVVSHVPEEYRKKIVYTSPGRPQRMKDRIPASTAMTILNLKKTHGLNRTQTRAIFKYTADSNPNSGQLHKIGPLVKAGLTVAAAIEKVADYEKITTHVYIPEKVVKKLETKYSKKVNLLIVEYLSQNKEFQIDVQEQSKVAFRLKKGILENKIAE